VRLLNGVNINGTGELIKFLNIVGKLKGTRKIMGFGNFKTDSEVAKKFNLVIEDGFF